LALVAIATVSLSASSAVADGLDIGSTAPLSSVVHFCDTGTTFFQDKVAAAPGFTATSSGVVTSFSMMAPVFNPGSVALRTAREGPDNTYTITGASETHALASGRLNSFLIRVPITAGDVIAVHLPKQSLAQVGCDFLTDDTGDEVRWRSANAFDDPVGTTIATDKGGPDGGRSFRLNLSARIEPDADGDGYGDLTQDACPAMTKSHDECIPPNTFLKNGPAKRVVTSDSKAKVKISFFASEPATFTCKLDKARAKPCHGTFKAKVRPGRHRVTITATDQVGNVDPSPLVVKFKVVRDQA
jgi:hypothetical protein